MPYHQIVDMQDAFEAKGIHQANGDYELITIPHSSEHAYEYWSSLDGQLPNPLPISFDVKAYLKAVIGPFP